MKWFSLRLIVCSITVLVLINLDPARAQNARNCAWPLLISQEGAGNTLGPETYAKYWMMPIDIHYDKLTITGAYQNARYFSYVVYNSDKNYVPDENSEPVGLYDTKIKSDSKHTYTVTVSRNAHTAGNNIRLSTDYGWVVLRIYIPRDYDYKSESGLALRGGVPLPQLTVKYTDGHEETLQPCLPVNKLADVNNYVQAFFKGIDIIGDEGVPFTDRLWFAPPKNPPIRLMPNPDNKYVLMMPGNKYQSGRIIVIHGKAPTVPETTGDMRFWSFCNTDLELPMFTVNCTADLTTTLKGGYYTIVISDDLMRPDWLPPNVTWLPWGDEQYLKLMYLRNMLPSANFKYSIQQTLANCAFEWKFPKIPDRQTVDDKGVCTQNVMLDYYPVAVWCDKSTFKSGGWQACMKR